MSTDRELMDPRFDWKQQNDQPNMTRAQVEHEAYSQMLSDAMRPIKSGYEVVASFAENVEDGCTTVVGAVFGSEIARQHASDLSVDAQICLTRGHAATAEHLLRRNLRFSVSALGLDARETVDAAARLKAVQTQLHCAAELRVLRVQTT
jgi:predicted kinase